MFNGTIACLGKGPKWLKGLTSLRSPRINSTAGPNGLTSLKGRWQGSEKALKAQQATHKRHGRSQRAIKPKG